MIRITDFDQLLAQMVADIQDPEMVLEIWGEDQALRYWTPEEIEEGITPAKVDGYVLVSNEKHLVRKLNDKNGVWIAAVIPSADPDTVDEDNFGENNIFWKFILEKIDPGSMSDADEVAHYQKIQEITTSIKHWLRYQKLACNPFLKDLNLQSIHTDPEYQFGGWNGWSINGNFDTDGY